MPRNGSGVYSLPAGNPVVTGTTISSSGWANPTLSDLAAAITASIAVDGQTVPTANLPMGNFRHLNVANGQNTNEYATVGQIQTAGFQLLGGTSGTLNTSKNVTASSVTISNSNGQFSGTLALIGQGSYAPTLRSNGLTPQIEMVNGANTTVNFTFGDTGSFSAIGNITASGNINGNNITASGTVSGANITGTSDRRLKSHIKRIRNATDVVLSWVGVTFQRKGDKTKRRHAGFVADDMLNSAPELVFEDANGIKSIAYGNTSAYLAMAFRELEARVRKLEKKQ